MKVTYKRLFNYKFEVEASTDQLLLFDVKVPSKENSALNSKLASYLITKGYTVIK